MLIKKTKKSSSTIIVIILLIIFYYMLRVTTLVEQNNGIWSLEILTISLNNLYKISTTLMLSGKNLAISVGVVFFCFMVYETYRMQNKKNIQENSYGSAEWCSPKDIKNKRDKIFENNMILTQTELISKNMKISGMNRHVILLGRPGTRKIKILLQT